MENLTTPSEPQHQHCPKPMRCGCETSHSKRFCFFRTHGRTDGRTKKGVGDSGSYGPGVKRGLKVDPPVETLLHDPSNIRFESNSLIFSNLGIETTKGWSTSIFTGGILLAEEGCCRSLGVEGIATVAM